ncbi:MAG: hypothetical protein U9Q33_06920 [Campylobacterota bacterium]|nr:hypothetical protein [Campylobacterota bacterium]
MAQSYVVRIRTRGFSCVELNKSKDKVQFKKYSVFKDIEELKKFVKNKKNVTYLLFEPDFLKTSISLDKTITGRSSINSMILAKLEKDKVDTSNLRFKYFHSEENEKKSSITYDINGIYQNSESYQKYKKINIFSNSSIVSLENYALYALAQKFLGNRTFISIWMDEKSLTIVAGDKDLLYFSRNDDLEKSHDNLIDIVNKNITFAKQKARGLKFDTLTINDTGKHEDWFYQEIMEKSQLNLSTIIPIKDKVKNFSTEDFNKSIIEIGSLYLDYELDFTSSTIRSKVQFKQSLNIFIPIMLAITGFFAYDTYEKFNKYNKAKKTFEKNLHKLESMYPELKYRFKNKTTLNYILTTIRDDTNNDLVSQLYMIQSNIDYLKKSDLNLNLEISLDEFRWNPKITSVLKFTTVKNFNSLLEMNQFKAILRAIEKDIKNKIMINAEYNPNKLTGSVTVFISGKEGDMQKLIKDYAAVRKLKK